MNRTLFSFSISSAFHLDTPSRNLVRFFNSLTLSSASETHIRSSDKLATNEATKKVSHTNNHKKKNTKRREMSEDQSPPTKRRSFVKSVVVMAGSGTKDEEKQPQQQPQQQQQQPSTGKRQEVLIPGLPPGWKAYNSSKGVPFFWNSATKERSWTLPSIPTAAPAKQEKEEKKKEEEEDKGPLGEIAGPPGQVPEWSAQANLSSIIVSEEMAGEQLLVSLRGTLPSLRTRSFAEPPQSPQSSVAGALQQIPVADSSSCFSCNRGVLHDFFFSSVSSTFHGTCRRCLDSSATT